MLFNKNTGTVTPDQSKQTLIFPQSDINYYFTFPHAKIISECQRLLPMQLQQNFQRAG